MQGSHLLWSIVGGFLCAVLIRSAYTIETHWGFVLMFSALILFVGSRFSASTHAYKLTIISMILAAGAVGLWRMDSAIISGDSLINQHINERVMISGMVYTEPDVREANTRVSIHTQSISVASTTAAIDTRFMVTLPAHTPVRYGDVVDVSGIIRIPERFETGPDHSFDYPSYLAVSGIPYQLTSAHIDRTHHNSGNVLRAFIINLKQLFIRGLGNALPEPEAGLAGGITVGDKRSIGKELSDDFQRASLVHMLVLSGYNITIVLNTVAAALNALPRFVQFSTSTVVVLFFMALAGGAASAVRAGIMALIALYARETKRVFIPLRAVAVVSLGMVLWNPYVLAFDPSFQLSVLATIGLITFTPIFAHHLQWITEHFGLREIISSTLATQLLVLPLLLHQNGQLSLVALPANVLALIPVPFAMLASFVSALSGVIVPIAAPIISLPAYALLSYIIFIAHTFGSLPIATVQISSFGILWVAIAYVIIFFTWLHYEKRKSDLSAASSVREK